MILGDPTAPHIQSGGRATLDDLFRRAAARRPDAIALADPPDRAGFTDGAPRRLTYAEVDNAISAMASRLRQLGLTSDMVIGVQLPNTVDNVIALLGVLRAGMIAAPLPLLWRQADATEALGQVGAKAIVTASRVGGTDHCDLAMRIAAEIFPIRHVCGFGPDLADGVIPLDDIFAEPMPGPPPAIQRDGNPAGHVAIVTFERTPDGLAPVGRNHIELIAGGLAVLLEGRLEPDAVILAPCPPSSFAGLALTLLPWLLTGGTLTLHQPFDPAMFAAQCRHDRCDTVVLPGPLLPRLSEAGLLDHPELRQVLALWRAPERLATSRRGDTVAPRWSTCRPSARSRCSACAIARMDDPPTFLRSPDRAARPARRRAGSGACTQRGRDARRARRDGAAPRLSAGRRAFERAAPQSRCGRLRRHRPPMPA